MQCHRCRYPMDVIVASAGLCEVESKENIERLYIGKPYRIYRCRACGYQFRYEIGESNVRKTD